MEKIPISVNIFRKWSGVGQPAISSDGNYAMYTIYNDPVGNNNKRLLIKSLKTNWYKEFKDVVSSDFTYDGKKVLLQMENDSLAILNLSTNNVVYLSKVSTYQFPQINNSKWVACSLKSPVNEIVLYNLITHEKRQFTSVLDFQLSKNGEVLLLKRKALNNKQDYIALELVDLSNNKEFVLWNGYDAENYCLSGNGEKLVFTTNVNFENRVLHELWYYAKGMDSAKKINCATPQILKVDSTLTLANILPEFSSDEESVFFKLMSQIENKKNISNSQVEIFRYDDNLLNINPKREENRYYYTAVAKLKDSISVQVIAGKSESLVGYCQDQALIVHNMGNESIYESFWNELAKDTYYLINLKSGLKKQVQINIELGTNIGMSPSGKWLIYFDRLKKSFYSYEVNTGIIRDITKDLMTNWKSREDEKPLEQITWMPTRRTWLGNDEAVFIYDEFDIWQIDPSGENPPINLTNGVGKKEHIRFEFLQEGKDLYSINLEKKTKVILVAFNKVNKENGFYSKIVGSAREPEKLSMGPYLYYWPYLQYNDQPLKAREASVYLVKRMSGNEAPNYFITNDFKKFTAVSNVQPQNAFNWITSELVTWNTYDDNISTGILYKPANFNPANKYPVIFHYYEKRSDELNMFLRPAASESGINIPYFVSNGYVVFVPDIHYKRGNPGESSYNAVVSAAHYLSKFPWVDSSKMGLQGHSFGAYETNYIITHTKLFACAVSADGVCDLVSFYGSASRNGYPMYWSEMNQGRIGNTIWEAPEAYIKNSPIYYADKVTTPLLIVHSKADGVVPFSQALEFFTALRRLRKKAWLLQYNDGGHTLEGLSAIDYTIRMKEFYDYYLKGEPFPIWMCPVNGKTE